MAHLQLTSWYIAYRRIYCLGMVICLAYFAVACNPSRPDQHYAFLTPDPSKIRLTEEQITTASQVASEPAQGEYLTVEQVWQNARQLGGKVVRVRGKAEYSQMMTMQLCRPARCDCNQTTGIFHLKDDPPSHVNAKNAIDDYLWVSGVQCRGDECSMTCAPFQPQNDMFYELVGTLKVHYEGDVPVELQLVDLDLPAARQQVQGEWVSIPTGSFTTERKTIGCQGARQTRLSYGYIARASLDPAISVPLHADAGASTELVGWLEPGEDVLVLGGPRCADNATWYEVRSRGGLEGWVAEGDEKNYWLVDVIAFENAPRRDVGARHTYDLREIRLSAASPWITNIESEFLPLETPVPTPLAPGTPWPNESQMGRAGMEDEWVNYAAHSQYKFSGVLNGFLLVYDLHDPLSRAYMQKKDGSDCLQQVRDNLDLPALDLAELNPFCGMNGSASIRYIINRQRIEFTGGQGYRFLVSYSHNDSVRWNIYIFQGLSDDNDWFIYLNYASVAVPYLYSDVLLKDLNAREDFFTRMEKLIDAGLTPFEPPLEALDNLMRSIVIK